MAMGGPGSPQPLCRVTSPPHSGGDPHQQPHRPRPRRRSRSPSAPVRPHPARAPGGRGGSGAPTAPGSSGALRGERLPGPAGHRATAGARGERQPARLPSPQPPPRARHPPAPTAPTHLRPTAPPTFPKSSRSPGSPQSALSERHAGRLIYTPAKAPPTAPANQRARVASDERRSLRCSQSGTENGVRRAHRRPISAQDRGVAADIANRSEALALNPPHLCPYKHLVAVLPPFRAAMMIWGKSGEFLRFSAFLAIWGRLWVTAGRQKGREGKGSRCWRPLGCHPRRGGDMGLTRRWGRSCPQSP